MKTQILIVEDELIVAKDLQLRLELLEYEVIGMAVNKQEALDLLRHHSPQLALMDVMLKDGDDGIALANIFRKEYNIPVIFLTAYSDNATLQRAKLIEPFGYLVKPFEEREIHAVIEMTLYKHEMELKLMRSEQWLSSMMQSLGDAAIAVDNQGNINFFNIRAEMLFGISSTQAMGADPAILFSIISEETRQPIRNPLIQSLILNCKVESYKDFRIRLPNKTEPPIEFVASPIIDEKNNCIGSVLILKDITAKRIEQSEKQRQREEAERNLMSTIVETQENERRRIAEDLHDGLGQILYAAKLNLNTIENTEIAEQKQYNFEIAKTLIDQAIEEARNISHNLMPGALYDFGLISTLESYFERLEASKKLSIHFHTNIDSRLPLKVEFTFYRIIQEIFVNIIKHSDATEVNIQLLLRENDNLVLLVEDNGKGFDTSDVKNKGFGLKNIESRIKTLNGQFNIDSAANHGTTVIVETHIDKF
ncbi:MAG: response regulator [Bacteroidia bacterium]|nr:response regulator [Bacteroidia bacterium]